MDLFLDAQLIHQQESPSRIHEDIQMLNSQESITPESSISQKTPQEFFRIDGCLAEFEMDNKPLQKIRTEKKYERATRRNDKKGPKVENESKKTKRLRKTRELPVLQSHKLVTGRITLKKGVFEKGKSSVKRSLGFSENQFPQSSNINIDTIVKQSTSIEHDKPTLINCFPKDEIVEIAEMIPNHRNDIPDLEQILRANLDPIINELDFYIPTDDRIVFE